MITPGLEEPVITPKAWVEMDGFKALCDRCLFVAWARPLEYAKEFLDDAVEEAKLRIPVVKGVIGRYGDAGSSGAHSWDKYSPAIHISSCRSCI